MGEALCSLPKSGSGIQVRHCILGSKPEQLCLADGVPFSDSDIVLRTW